MAISNKQILYVKKPTPAIDPNLSNGTFALRNSSIQLPIPADNVLVRTHYISLDPAMRQWLTAKRSYIAPVELGDVMRSQAVAQVVHVGDNLKGQFKTGEWLIAGTGWQEYALVNGKDAAKQRAVVPPGCSPTDAMSVLGAVGLTAYFGLLEVGQMRQGDTVVVSGAAGATGTIVGQIAKIKGAKRVIGLAGSPDKCRFLAEELGFDVAINYKDADWKKQLRAACPDYIDVYFDNVGGEILDACLGLAARDARFAICGHISQYSAARPEGPKNIMMMIGQRVMMKGFIFFDYHKQFPSALNDLRQWLVEGKIKRKEFIIKGGLEACPQGLVDLLTPAALEPRACLGLYKHARCPISWHRQHAITTATREAAARNNEQFRLENLFNVRNKVALVTGGGSGIGLMATQALAVNGAKVYIVGRTEEKLERVAELYSTTERQGGGGGSGGGQIIPLTADISQKGEIARLLHEFQSRENSLSILVNNAGISSQSRQDVEREQASGLKQTLFDDEAATPEDWESVYRTNVTQLYFMSSAFLPLLEKSNRGADSSTIINISSISGIVKSSQHHFPYNASKAAAIHLTKMLAHEVSSSGLRIRVNNIAPGVFPSEMTAQGQSDEKQKSELPREKYEQKVPARRPGCDRDMGNAVLFAATNQYLNGQTVVVDGGLKIPSSIPSSI
ncbi:hypothetical protein UA08_02472 [Talaromyces atroroseus]|uniref:Enoyl reductase (ER) domain-containing protein n=1 Tax=Talaromyces atroroseus TaxID=1441469 RepID=A0A225AXX4_TALAT|nr:hypothetical protein UA08_02472 [Talaromyces atroroseus]OKL62188.1 hypothetical protein UA08_02472 [Talaromyces atroroseus]